MVGRDPSRDCRGDRLAMVMGWLLNCSSEVVGDADIEARRDTLALRTST